MVLSDLRSSLIGIRDYKELVEESFITWVALCCSLMHGLMRVESGKLIHIQGIFKLCAKWYAMH